MIRVENIHKSFGDLKVLKGVDLHIAKGEIVSIVGASGAGKSTLLNIMGSLMPPQEGKVFIDSTDIFALGAKELASFRNHEIGFVFQFHHLLPEFTALENVLMPAMIGGAKWGDKECTQRAMMLLEDLGVAERASHKPMQMSGGEQQRVAIARALVNEPKVLLLDEPLGALDAFTRMNMQDEILNIWADTKQLALMVTHDVDEAIYMGTRVLVMDANPGRIIADIKIDEPFPRDRSSAKFVEYRNDILNKLHFGGKHE